MRRWAPTSSAGSTSKTPDFSLSGGDIGGTVNIKLPTPFDNPGFHASGLYSESDASNDGQATPEFGGLVSDTFADNTIGILVDGEYDDQRTDEHHLSMAGWEGTYLNSCQMAGGPACTPASGAPADYSEANSNIGTSTTPKNTAPSWFIQDYALYNDRTDERRKTGRAVLQWHPNDALMVTLNDNYSDDRILSDRSEYSLWFTGSDLYNVQTDANGTVTNFDYDGEPTDFDADVDGSYIKNNELGANVLWVVNDDWTAELDVDQSGSWLNPEGQISNIDADAGYGPSSATPEALGYPNSFTGQGVTVPGGNSIPYEATWGPNGDKANVLGLNPLILGSHVFPIQYQHDDDYINEAQLGVTWHSGATQIRFGGQVSNDNLHQWAYDDFYNNGWQVFSGYGSPSGNTGGVALPGSLFSGGISTSNFFPGWSGNGLQPSSILEYNPWSVYNYLVGLPLSTPGVNPGAISTGAPYTGGAIPIAFDPTSYGSVLQKQYAPYFTISHAFDVGSKTLNSELALRYNRTENTTGAIYAPLTGLTISTSDHTNEVPTYGTAAGQTTTNSYGYFLPSLDLNFMALDDLKVRFDASRTETQPPINYITPSATISGTRVGQLTASTNNPYLLPYLSNNLDLGAEWYYSQNDYVSVDGYFKHVTSVPRAARRSHRQLPGRDRSEHRQTRGVRRYGVSQRAVGERGWRGAHLAADVADTGFGYTLNANVIHSNTTYNPNDLTNQFALPGVGNSANVVGLLSGARVPGARRGATGRRRSSWYSASSRTARVLGTEPTFLDSATEVDFSRAMRSTAT